MSSLSAISHCRFNESIFCLYFLRFSANLSSRFDFCFCNFAIWSGASPIHFGKKSIPNYKKKLPEGDEIEKVLLNNLCKSGLSPGFSISASSKIDLIKVPIISLES